MNDKLSVSGLLDVHTHILPGMDDGSSSVEESAAMLRCLKEQGVSAAALTPHFYPGRESPEEFLKRREAAFGLLVCAVGSEPDMPEMLPGAEVEYFEGISRAEAIEQMCIGRSRILLVEMPFATWNRRMIAELAALRDKREITPLLAHTERYLHHQHRGMVEELCEQGFLIQVNASFFVRNRTVLKALHMLNRRRIHLVGSDCHNMESRPPNMGAAFERIRLMEDGAMHLKRMQAMVLERCCL